MHTKLGIHFPVYLMITKLDLLHGFNEFFNHLTEEQRNQYLGIPLSNTEGMETPIATASNALADIVDKLRSSMLGTVHQLESTEDKAAAFAFPEEFERLNQAVLSLFKELSKSSKFEQPIAWRGVYFQAQLKQDNISTLYWKVCKVISNYLKNTWIQTRPLLRTTNIAFS